MAQRLVQLQSYDDSHVAMETQPGTQAHFTEPGYEVGRNVAFLVLTQKFFFTESVKTFLE